MEWSYAKIGWVRGGLLAVNRDHSPPRSLQPMISPIGLSEPSNDQGRDQD